MAVSFAIALLLGGCGSDTERVATTPATAPPVEAPATTQATTHTSTTPTTTTEVGVATIPGTTTTVPGTTPSTTPASGAGDEEGAHVPAVFEIGSAGVTPSVVKVPAFLAIELTGVSKDGKQHLLGLSAGTDYTLAIPAGGRASKVVPGLHNGKYLVILDGRQTTDYLKVGD